MTKDEALTVALEALNSGEDVQIGRVVWTEYDSSLVQEAITAIKAALAQPTTGDYAMGYAEGFNDACKPVQPDNTSKLYEELRAIIDSGSESFTHADAVQYLKDNLTPLKWTPEDMAYRPGGLVQPEPMACPYCARPLIKCKCWGEVQQVWKEWSKSRLDVHDDRFAMIAIDNIFTKVHAALVAPPKRQPLTNSQIWQLVNDCTFADDLHADKFARAVEAAHGIGDKT